MPISFEETTRIPPQGPFMDDTFSLPVQTPSPTARSTPGMTFLESPAVLREPEPPFSESVPLRVHTVQGAGGVSLRVYDAGDFYGPPLLFLHGFSQCHLAWHRQFQSA